MFCVMYMCIQCVSKTAYEEKKTYTDLHCELTHSTVTTRFVIISEAAPGMLKRQHGFGGEEKRM